METVVDDAVEAVVAESDLEEAGVDGEGDVEVADNEKNDAQETSCDYRLPQGHVLNRDISIQSECQNQWYCSCVGVVVMA